jgi:hypothetical protein
MAGARLTEGDLAAKVGVDTKTVGRWISGRLPHPRHRYAVAGALGVEENMLWPEALRAALKTGHDREIVAAYPFRSAIPRSLWRDLITGAKDELTFAGYTNYFLWLEVHGLRPTLARKAQSGTVVRFLVGDPGSETTRTRERIEAVPLTVSTRIQVTLAELTKLHEQEPAVQGRLSDRHIALSVFRFDNQMIVNVHIADLLGNDSPTLHLRRHEQDGMFDRFAAHVESLWASGRPMWTTS